MLPSGIDALPLGNPGSVTDNKPEIMSFDQKYTVYFLHGSVTAYFLKGPISDMKPVIFTRFLTLIFFHHTGISNATVYALVDPFKYLWT